MSLRPATADDAPALGALHAAAMRGLSFLPLLHTEPEVIAWMGACVLPQNQVWVAERDGVVAGYIAFTDSWIHQLYVRPDRQGQGVGPQLLAKALADGRARRLWTFQKNARARRFYEARGFVLVELTDGARNEEREPDALYEWRPSADRSRHDTSEIDQGL